MSAARKRMQADLTVAMKARDTVRVSVLRSTLAALANAEAVVPGHQSSTPVAFGTTEVPRRELTDADDRAILAREISELESTADDLRQRGRPDEAADHEARATIIRSYLDNRGLVHRRTSFTHSNGRDFGV